MTAKLLATVILLAWISRVRADVACSEEDFTCRNGIGCVKSTWVCDGEPDCVDESDEDNCSQKQTCTEFQFTCDNGQCIPLRWHCNGDFDCRDESDEKNDTCSQKTCPSDTFACGKRGQCIPMGWRCDGEVDCADDSDEADCPSPPPCVAGEFECTTIFQCINERYVCDGDYDCDDDSDEASERCNSRVCSESQFQCVNSTLCINENWRCDGDVDCDDGSDERDCNVPQLRIARRCSDAEFMCTDGECIMQKWRCDRTVDCDDGSDEIGCVDYKSCHNNQFACDNGQCIFGHRCDGDVQCTDGSDERDCPAVSSTCENTMQFDCGNGQCIDHKDVCDGSHDDCGNNADEDDAMCALANPCDVNNGGCLHECMNLHRGRMMCHCRPGYVLDQDGKHCKDIDECEDFGRCSQLCTNLPGSYYCSCTEGYHSEFMNPAMCKLDPSLHDEPTLIFVQRYDMSRITLHTGHYQVLLNNTRSSVALDFDYVNKRVYYSDVAEEKIRVHDINRPMSNEDVLTEDINTPDGLAFDWVHQNLYWTDTYDNTISVYSVERKIRKTLFSTDLDEPSAIVVDPRDNHRTLYWSDWGAVPKIERSGLDGRDRQTIAVNGTLVWPNGLTIDYVTDRLYWVDAKNHNIGTCKLDGSDNRLVYANLGALKHPFAITVFEDWLYWSDRDGRSISKANKFGSEQFNQQHQPMHVVHSLKSPKDLNVFHALKQPQSHNVCGDDNGGCSHLCLPSRYVDSRSPRFSCACPDEQLKNGVKIYYELDNKKGMRCIQHTIEYNSPGATGASSTTPEVNVGLSRDDSSLPGGAVAAIVISVLLMVVGVVIVVSWFAYRSLITKNGRKMKFDNPVYSKTAEDFLNLKKHQYQPAGADADSDDDLSFKKEEYQPVMQADVHSSMDPLAIDFDKA